MNNCDYNKKGKCTAPIPIKCGDRCVIAELTAELKAQLKDNLECEKEYNILAKQYKAVLINYNQLIKDYNQLQEEISLTS